MPVRAWAGTLFEAAYRRGWLALPAFRKGLVLVEQGLHPEQVLLGMGLLTVDRYLELAEACFGVSLQRLDYDAWTKAGEDAPLPPSAALATDEAGRAMVLAADAWDPEVAAALTGEAVFPVLRSELQRWQRRGEPLDLSVSAWWEAFLHEGATEARLALEEGRGEAWVGANARPVEALAIAREELPAVQAWLEAGYPRREWRVRRHPGLEGDVLEIAATHDGHPLARLASWQGFFAEPRGILLCLSPDAWLDARLAHLPEARDAAALLGASGPVRVRPSEPALREACWQAALAGCPLCWVEDAPGDLGWLRALAAAGVQATVVRRRETLDGTAWESYRLSV